MAQYVSFTVVTIGGDPIAGSFGPTDGDRSIAAALRKVGVTLQPNETVGIDGQPNADVSTTVEVGDTIVISKNIKAG